MSQKRTVPLKTATAAELREYATVTMGIEVGPKLSSSQILAKMEAAGFSRDEIEVSVGQTQKEGGTSIGLSPDATHVRVLIPVEDKPGGDEPVALSINGKAFYIPRGAAEVIPVKYFEVLKNAVAYSYEEYIEGLGGLSKPRRVQAVPFSMLGEATP